MFEPSDTPRLFGLAPGVDFPQALVDGLRTKLKGQDASAMARVELFVNTERMQRRITDLFRAGPAGFLPRIRLITDLSRDAAFGTIAPAINPLARRLELAQLVRRLIETNPDIAPQDSAYDLADSLATLMDEIQSEGVSPSVIAGLDVGDHSDHWARSQAFINLVQHYFNDAKAPDTQTRQRLIVEHLIDHWASASPSHPVIVAGSTGSRGTTNLFMQAVAKLPQGAVILPGFDFSMTAQDRACLDPGASNDGLGSQDHPQYRFRDLMRALKTEQVEDWGETNAPNPVRNAIISLALRPAPVTDSWMTDGKKLSGFEPAMEDVTLIEAPNPRLEAMAIAARLRLATERGQRAALITPDRQLTRQVTAALQRWSIEPDDSAGIPLSQSAPGRLLRQVAELTHRKLTSEALLSLLKHPLVDIGARSARVGDLEVQLLRRGLPFPTRDAVLTWAETRSAETVAWANWLFDCIEPLAQPGDADLSAHLERLIDTTERLSEGADPQKQGLIWEKNAGEKAKELVERVRGAAEFGGVMSPREFADLFQSLLAGEEVRDPLAPHDGVMIWGTLEARVQGADLVILAGLNDGIWPEAPKPDPWLNRKMRLDAGLLLPERSIGLSAHDFQQAIGAKEVWLTRAARDAEAQTVPSRWLNRISNLLRGLCDESKVSFAQMKQRGDYWIDLAAAIDRPGYETQKAKRPAPRPAKSERPKSLSVTGIQTLIRDPYAIYAKYVLNLKALDPLNEQPDAPLRGQVLHAVLQAFTEQTKSGLPDDAQALLMQLADEEFARSVPWPAMRQMWRAKLARVAPWFLGTERERRLTATPIGTELEAELELVTLAFTLHGRADRVDQTSEGQLIVYDYKTGAIPTGPVQEKIDKQLPLLACLAERGGFEKLAKSRVARAGYIGLGSDLKEVASDYSPGELDKIWEEFGQLIARYAQPAQGYLSRRDPKEMRATQDYDHLARFGEWEMTDHGHPEEVSRDPE